MDAAAIRRFVRGREAAAEAERARLARAAPSPDWSIALGLSLIKAAEDAGLAGRGPDPVADRQDEMVRATWRRLRERW